MTTTNGGRTLSDANTPQAYRINEVAQILRVGRNQAYEAAKRGEIPSIRIGKRLIVPGWFVRQLEKAP
jgi:excisionase family DNA binding protein